MSCLELMKSQMLLRLLMRVPEHEQQSQENQMCYYPIHHLDTNFEVRNCELRGLHLGGITGLTHKDRQIHSNKQFRLIN